MMKREQALGRAVWRAGNRRGWDEPEADEDGRRDRRSRPLSESGYRQRLGPGLRARTGVP